MGRKISILQIFSIYLLSTGFSNHVILTPLLIHAAGRDAWISVAIGYVGILLFSILIVSISKQFQQISCLDWLASRGSIVLKWFITILLVLYVFVIGWISMQETINWTNETYLIYTPLLVITIVFLVPSIYISFGSLNVIAVCSGILLPFVILLGVFVSIGTMPDKNYHLLTPILVENGWFDIMRGSLYVFGSNIELILLIFLQHQIRTKIKLSHLLLLNTLLAGLIIGPIMGSIAVFGVKEASYMNYPSFFQWRMLRIGDYFNHLDFLAIYQWSAGNLIRSSLSLYIISQVLVIKRPKPRFFFLSLICFALFLCLMLPISHEEFRHFLTHYYYVISTGIAILIVLIIAIVLKLSRKGMSSYG